MRRRLLAGPSLDSRFTLAGSCPPLPLESPCLWIAGLETPRIIQVIPADADQDVIPHDHRRRGRRVVELRIRDLDSPALFARARIQTDEVAVGRLEKEPVSVHADAPVADGAAGVPRILIM